MKVFSYPRVHVALADLAGATARRYGGAGFAIDGLPTVIDFRLARRSSVELPHGYDKAAIRHVSELCDRFRKLAAGVSIVVEAAPPQHIGLGSKTSLTLGLLVGLHYLRRRYPSREYLQRASGRGGASGVGINSFFDGGFVVDGGHAFDAARRLYVPSSAAVGHSPPPVIARHVVPPSWRFTLLLPLGHRRFGPQESRFFRKHTPISKGSALRTIALLYHGVAAAVATRDLTLLATTLKQVQRTGFKRVEVRGQTLGVRRLLRDLEGLSLAAGMSSMGPVIYVVTETGGDALAARTLAANRDAILMGTFPGRNLGHEVVDD
jgi:beta-ribofuranosylaminobenzene 5'-phosphate synthase